MCRAIGGPASAASCRPPARRSAAKNYSAHGEPFATGIVVPGATSLVAGPSHERVANAFFEMLARDGKRLDGNNDSNGDDTANDNGETTTSNSASLDERDLSEISQQRRRLRPGKRIKNTATTTVGRPGKRINKRQQRTTTIRHF
jgi:hypothetical protein